MKCARCLWAFLNKPYDVQARLLRRKSSGKPGTGPRDAVTIYRGNALCGVHLEEERAARREEGADPWR
jgi:hypothetical protein